MSPANLILIKKQLSKSSKGWTDISVNEPVVPITIEDGTGYKFQFKKTGKKPTAAGGGAKPSTKQQEKVTLRIFQELLQKSGPDYARKGYQALAEEQLSKLYPDVLHPGQKKWGKHFELQYNEARDVTNLPNNTFDVFDYDEFMDFIVEIIIGGPPTSGTWPVMGKVSKKDSWNPADIWLVQGGSKFSEIKKKLQSSGTILELNAVLKAAFHQNIIIGISLKQSSGKPGGLHYELVNLEAKLKQLPKVFFTKWKIEVPFDGDKFEKTTWEISVLNESKKQIANMRTGSNTTGVGNNTYEMKPSGAATAMLGKVDKGLLLKRLQLEGIKINELPTWQSVRNLRPRSKGDINYVHWTKVANALKKSSLIDFEADNIAEDLLIMGVKDPPGKGIEKTESAVMQMLSFADILTKVGKSGIDELIEDFYYFAQKKGGVFGSEFGPFAKLS
jgi:hypothetical protein